jgi:hypothetical protein
LAPEAATALADEAGAARVPAAEYVRMSTEHQRYSTDNQSDVTPNALHAIISWGSQLRR